MERSPSTSLLLDIEDEERSEINEGCFTRFLNAIYKSEGDDDEDFSSVKPVSFLELFRFASGREKAAIAAGILLSILVGMCTPAHIWLCGVITTLYVDVKEPKGDLDFLHHIWRLSSLYGVLGIITFTLGYFENWLHLWASERIAQRVRSAFIASVLARDTFDASDTAATGELSNRLNSNIDRLKDGIGDNIGTFVRTIAMFTSGTILSFYLDWRTTLLLIGTGPACLLTSTLIPLMSSTANSKVVRLSEEANGISEEALLNIKTVVSCNGEKTMIERYSASLLAAVAPATRCGFYAALCDAVSCLFHYVFHTAGMWYGTIAYHSGRIEGAGSVFAVVSVAMGSAGSFTRLGPHLMAVIKARAAAAKVYHTIDSRPRDDDCNEKLDPANAEMRIQFERVSVTFPSRTQPALENLSFDLSPGESLALVGKSGCGKSTTLKLIPRFLYADSGRVLLDGQPLENYDKKRWRKMVGVVSQEPALFHGTIRENICLGRTYSEKEVEDACRVAYAHEFIMGLEEGYSTLLGPSGVSLSGGQKQRIAIARAIVSNPRLLLLDEATSALDTKSERIVQEALDKASEGRTTIVVAHRLSTIKNVNRVIVMEEGKVVESGGYDELRNRPDGIFARMVAAQEIERRHQDREVAETSSEDFSDDSKDDSIKRSVSVDEAEAQEFPVTLGGLFSLYFYNKPRAIYTTILSLAKGVEMPVLVLTFCFVFNSLKDPDYEDELFWTMIGTLVLGGTYSIACLISQTVSTYTGEATMRDMRVACFTSLLKRPMAYFDRKETSPAATSVLLSQQPPIAMAIVHHSMSNLIEHLFAGFMISMAPFFIYAPFGLIGVAYVTIFFTTFAVVEHFCNKAYNEVVKIDTSLELAVEIFDNTSTIQQLAVESHFQERFDDIQMKRRKPLATKLRCLSLVHAINESDYMLLDCAATSIGIYFVYTGIISIKQMYQTEICIAFIGYSAICMSESFKDIISATSAARLLFRLIDPSLKGKKEETGTDNMMLRGKVTADSISFSYPSRPRKRVLNEASFAVDEGRSLALVGPSGGGKSTIVNLLERFYHPTQGQLYLDNIPYPSIPATSLRSAIALVSQEPVLFRGTILDNVRLGLESVSEDEVRDACRKANARDFIESFPEGYRTLVGEKGRSLSGGQKQRIAIARALVRNPRVIVLDEATSALDSQSEQVVREALLTSSQGRTSITIAHRLDTIRHCDEICFVEGGRIVERGNHDELMEKRGRYSEMVEQQRLS